MKATAASSELPPPDKPAPKLGLFSYPVLQAADILVHRATHVPVGEDQSQHLEFARECATNFNNAYGECLIAPETMLSREKRIMSLRRPTVKMSKSDPDASSRISITDDDDTIARKVSSALTDSNNSVSYDPLGRPGVANLLNILSSFDKDGREPAVLAEAMAGSSLQDLKQSVSDSVIRGLGDIRERYLELLDADGGKYLDHVANDAAVKARESASNTMELVRERLGL